MGGDELPQHPLRRSLRLAGLPAAHAGRVALGLGKRIGGRPAELVAQEAQARTAAQLFATLGQLKGGALKLGQALSAMEALMPAELAAPYTAALTRLQEAAPPLPAATVHRVLADELGAGWRDRFATFDDAPAAAASIGQVHRATWHDGTPVAVKVQYPGAAEALTADLRQLDRIAPVARLGAPALDFRALFSALRARLVEELDYEHEAAAQQAFVDAFRDDDVVAVPRVLAATRRVLVTEWFDGTPIAGLIRDGEQRDRDRAGAALLHLFLSAPARAQRVHGDPHPGNFRLLADGRLGVLDFGSSEPTPDGWPPSLGALLAAARDGDASTLHATAVEAGLIDADAVEPSILASVIDPWMAPLRRDTFHFDRRWIQPLVRPWSDPRTPQSRLQRKVRVPARHLLVQRVAFGLLGVLTSLDATIAVRGPTESAIPGLG